MRKLTDKFRIKLVKGRGAHFFFAFRAQQFRLPGKSHGIPMIRPDDIPIRHSVNVRHNSSEMFLTVGKRYHNANNCMKKCKMGLSA